MPAFTSTATCSSARIWPTPNINVPNNAAPPRRTVWPAEKGKILFFISPIVTRTGLRCRGVFSKALPLAAGGTLAFDTNRARSGQWPRLPLVRSMVFEKKILLAGLGFLALGALVRGGPPFATDDPEPVEYRHWEIYLASQYQHATDGAAGTLPHVEVNYGAL